MQRSCELADECSYDNILVFRSRQIYPFNCDSEILAIQMGGTLTICRLSIYLQLVD